MTFFFSRNSFLIHLFVYRDKTDTLYLLAFDRIFIIIYITITDLYQLLLWEIIEKSQFWKKLDVTSWKREKYRQNFDNFKVHAV